MCEGLPRAAGPRPSGDPRRERGWRSEPRGSRPPAPDPASAQPGLDAGAVRAERRRDADRRWPVRRPRPGTHGPGHRAGCLRARRSGSSPRPPAGQRAVGLQRSDLGVQQLALEQHLAQLCLQALGLQRLAVGGPRDEAGLSSGDEGVLPSGQGRSRDAQCARKYLQVLTPQQAQDRITLALARDIRPPRPKPTVPEAAVSVVIVTLLRITSAYRVSQRTGERSSCVLRPAPSRLLEYMNTGGERLVLIASASGLLKLMRISVGSALHRPRDDRDDRRPDIGELAADLERLGAQVLSLFGDLAEPSVPDRFIAETVKAFGGLDAVVSTAGVTSPASLLDLAVDDWDRMFAINVRPTWLLAKAAHSALQESHGAIVAISSASGLLPHPGHGAYSATKAALL